MVRFPLGRIVVGLVLLGLAAVLSAAGPAMARDDDERVDLRVEGVCGRTSAARLRLRADDGRIRVDLRVRTSTRGRWRLAVLHERRIVRRARVRATRAGRGFRYRVVLPDYAGPDAVRLRAASPRGETCSAAATVSAS